jgi:hypothetical protein
MRALQFWKAVTKDRSNFLDRLLALLSSSGIRFCAIGGVAVNAYVEPLVTLDFDVAIAPADRKHADELYREFVVSRSAHSLDLTAADSSLRVQIRAEPRYASFVDRARPAEVLGLQMPVAVLDDVLQGEIWSIEEGRRSRMGLLNVLRLIETYPVLAERVPPHILAQIPQ